MSFWYKYKSVRERVFYYFEELTRIPHGSGNTDAISKYCMEVANGLGLEHWRDEFNNVTIIKPATPGYENAPAVIIQGHLDMVGDKVPTCTIDMEKEPIKLMIDGDYLTADGTTLGGDDGIAVAYGLALLDAKDIPHPRLELVLTVSEEVGLLGATDIDLSCCKAKRLINIDSEEEGILYYDIPDSYDNLYIYPVIDSYSKDRTEEIIRNTAEKNDKVKLIFYKESKYLIVVFFSFV